MPSIRTSLASPTVVRICGAAMICVGISVLAGWVLRLYWLAGEWFGFSVPMSPITALMFFLLGVVLTSLAAPRPLLRRVAAIGGGTLLAVMGIFHQLDLLLAWRTGLDQWLLRDRLAERGLLMFVGMAPTTSFCFTTTGIGLILIIGNKKSLQICGQYLMALVLFLATGAIIGHLYDTPQFYQVNRHLFPMASATAASFVIAAAGVLALRPGLGFIGTLTAPNLGGIMARRLLPSIFVFLPLLGLLIATGPMPLTPKEGIAAAVLLTGALLAAAVLIISRQLGKTFDALTQRSRELEIARREADSANRAKSEFLANMSHELRTPLNAIIGFSELLREAKFGPISPRYSGYAGDILDSGLHLLGIVNDILDLAKIEARRLELVEYWISLADLTAACFTVVQDKATQGGVTLRAGIPADFPPLYVDEKRLKQVLLNLLYNSVKFTASGGTVTLTARTDPSGPVEIRVRDTGIGMAEDAVTIAFIPFRQVDSTLSRRYEGTGLGLPLARALVEQHGGTLDLESCPGVGTTAIISLPRVRIIGERGPDEGGLPEAKAGDAVPGRRLRFSGHTPSTAPSSAESNLR